MRLLETETEIEIIQHSLFHRGIVKQLTRATRRTMVTLQGAIEAFGKALLMGAIKSVQTEIMIMAGLCHHERECAKIKPTIAFIY